MSNIINAIVSLAFLVFLVVALGIEIVSTDGTKQMITIVALALVIVLTIATNIYVAMLRKK